jgi:hypothetical protein
MGARKYAAVPQEPTIGPIATPSMAAQYSSGKLGPESGCKQPLRSNHKIEQTTPGRTFSISTHKRSAVAFSASPLATISRMTF